MGAAMGAQIVISLYQMWADELLGYWHAYRFSAWEDWRVFRYLAALGAVFRLHISPLLNRLAKYVTQMAQSCYSFGIDKLQGRLSRSK